MVRPGPAIVTEPDVSRWLPFDDLDRLFDALRADGRTIIGPVVRDEGYSSSTRSRARASCPPGLRC